MVKIDGIHDIKKMMHGEHESQKKVTVGYVTDDNISRDLKNVGDKWTDSDGNEWIQKDGYKVKLGKDWQQDLHEYLHTFPKCKKEICACTMPKKIDEKMRKLHGMCLDCVVYMEHKLRLDGEWDEYEKQKIKENAISWLAEAEKDKDIIAEELSKTEFANEFGDSEKWTVPFTKEELLEKIENEFKGFKENFIKKLV